MSEVEIGPTAMLEDAPLVVVVDGDQYILSVSDGDPHLFSAVCPHQGGRVTVADEETLQCPNHRWQFDATSGDCISGGDTGLREVPLRERAETLYAVL